MADESVPDFLKGFSAEDYDIDLGIQFLDERPEAGTPTEVVEAIGTQAENLGGLETKVDQLQSTLSGIKNLLDFDDIHIEGKLDKIIDKLDEEVVPQQQFQAGIGEEKLDKIISAIGDPMQRKVEIERRLQESIDAHKEKIDDKLTELEKLTLPLLVNLIKPESLEQKYIYWPNRKEIIERQIKRILYITRDGEETA